MGRTLTRIMTLAVLVFTVVLLFSSPAAPTVQAQGPVDIAWDMVDDTSQNLTSFAVTDPTTIVNPNAQCFQKESYNSIVTGGVLPEVVDTGGADSWGIITAGSNADADFFCIENAFDPAPNYEPGVAEWVFDVTGYDTLFMSIDAGAMGNYDNTAWGVPSQDQDFFLWEYDIDGGGFQTAMEGTANVGGIQTYTLSGGASGPIPNPMQIDADAGGPGAAANLSNTMQTFTSAQFSGSGSTLTIRLTARTAPGGAFEPIAFQNLLITGTQIPTVAATGGTNAAEAGPTNGSFTFTITNPRPTPMTFNYTLGGTAADPADYSITAGTNVTAAGAGTFTVAANSTSATLNVVPVNDTEVELTETVQLTLTANASYILGTASQTIDITSDDPGTVNIGAVSGSTDEANPATQATYTIALGEVPPGGTSVTVTVTPSSQCTVDQPSVILSDTTPATITVTAVDDTDVEANPHTCAISHAVAAGSSTPYLGVVVNMAMVNVADDDTVAPTPDPGTGGGTTTTTSQSGSEWAITMVAAPPFAQPGTDVVFTITVAKLSGGTPVTMTFPVPAEFVINSVSSTRGSASFSGQTVTFTDDISVGEQAAITVNTTVADGTAVPFSLLGQACITSPVTLCATATVSYVAGLPATGETPAWAAAVQAMMQVNGITPEQAAAGITLDELGMTVEDLAALGITIEDLAAAGLKVTATFE